MRWSTDDLHHLRDTFKCRHGDDCQDQWRLPLSLAHELSLRGTVEILRKLVSTCQWKRHCRAAIDSSGVTLLRFIIRRYEMSLGTILLVIVILLLIGAVPSWPHSRDWGYGPSGGIGLVLVILIILLLMGKI